MELDRLEDLQDTGPDWSVSRLQTIMQCGKKYHYKYVDKVPEQKTVPLAFGSALHKCIETLHLENKWEDGYIQRLWSDVWYNAQEGIDWDSTPVRKSTYDNKGIKVLDTYTAKHKDDQWTRLEMPFRFTPGNGMPYLRGMFDKIQILTEHPDVPPELVGRTAIIDYKSGKNPPDPILLQVDPQFSIYHKAYKVLYSDIDPVLGLHHLLTDTIYWCTRKDEDWWTVEEELREGMDRVKQEKWERNIDWQCKFCPFKKDCLGGINAASVTVHRNVPK